MLTVPEAALRVGRDPETIRRWIRSGRLRASKVGTQHVIEEVDLDAVIDEGAALPLPAAWAVTRSGRSMPNPEVAVVNDGLNQLDEIARGRGITRAEAARQAFAETAERDRRRSGLAAEAAALLRDPDCTREALEVAALMEQLRAPR